MDDYRAGAGQFFDGETLNRVSRSVRNQSVARLTLDSGTLKLKVAASIVAISSIHLLRIFMNAHQTPNDKILWYVILHLTFVVSAVLLGVLDKISFAAHRKE